MVTNLTNCWDADRLQKWGQPVLMPVIGQVLDLPQATDRDAGTLACISAGVQRGAQIYRVRNVKAAAQAVKVLWAVR
ncbi:hypothetical protein [Brevifollis gellanilyticus]|uniref:Pterin-binding domain-containing protein n=1 Tax=Brevifollis gellanilyticus TaxID=748831 RepID=A0A512MET2_9BACT|nr:hypothetical protein [Brevifollis gellanilyticus]GEP45244.1 hypothetical protein BGE01nite_45350 [Brevifollis gellanilyticus]